MKLVCSWCDVVLWEVLNIETQEDYITPFICKACCDEVFEEGTEADISMAYEVIQAKSGRYEN